MSLIAAWERPRKPPKCFIYKLQSDSGKPDFPYVDLHIFMKITEKLVWVTPNGLRNFMIFTCFSKCQTTEKTKKTRIITFAQGFPLFLSLGLHQCTWFLHRNLKRKSLKTHLRKTYISKTMAKTNEISTCWPPIINRMTVWFFVFNENNVAFNYLWKNIKKHDISENHLKPTK